MGQMPEKLADAEIHIIPYSHADYSWTHSRQWHIQRYNIIINEVLDIMKAYEEFTWMIDNLSHMLEPFIKLCPARVEELKKRISEGRLEVTNGVVALLRPTQVGEETFIRNIVIGRKLIKNMFPASHTEVFHNVDVSIGHSQMPQLLKLGGYKYYRAWRPQGAMDKKGVPRQFSWKGMDGTEIICSRGTYAGLCGIDYLNLDYKSNWEEVSDKFYKKELKDILEHTDVPIVWLPHGMDDTRPLRDFTDKPARILEFKAEWNKREKARIKFSTAGEYFRKLQEWQLPIIEGVLDGCDVGYNTPTKGDKGLWRLREQLDRLLVQAEILSAFAVLQGENRDISKITAIWETLLKISGHAMEFAFAVDFEELYNEALTAVHLVKGLIRDSAFVLASKISKANYKQIVIFNTLNWEREENISIQLSFPCGVNDFIMEDERGRKLDYQVCSTYRGDIPYERSKSDEVDVVVNCVIPPMGYTTLKIKEKELDDSLEDFGVKSEDIDFRIESAASQAVNTGEIAVEFRNGMISGVTDLKDGWSLSCNTSGLFINDIRYTSVRHHPESAWLFFSHYNSVCHFVPEKWHWKEFGPIRWIYVVYGMLGPHKVVLEYILYKGKRHIDFNVDIECKERDNGFFSSAFLCGSTPVITVDVPFGIENRDMGSECYGKLTDNAIDNIERTWKGLFYSKSWVNYMLGDKRLSFVADSTGHYYLHDDGENSISTVLTRTFDLSKSTDWVKNIHSSSECIGKNNFRYSLYIHCQEDDGYKQVIRLAKEKAVEPEMVQCPERNFTTERQEEKSFLAFNESSIVLSAFYREDYYYILRFYESEGKNENLSVTTAKEIYSIECIDFLGSHIDREPVRISDQKNQFELVVLPWEIVSLKIRFRD